MAYPQPLQLFPFRPNWSRPFEETFEFRSWVTPSRAGPEHSGTVSGPHPRRHFEYELLLQGLAAQRFHSLMFSWMTRYFEMPHWSEKTALDSAVAEGATVLPVDTAYRSFAIGGRVVIHDGFDNCESHEITAVNADNLVIAAPGTTKAWPARSRVYPTLPGLLNPNISGSQLTDGLLRSPVVFDAEPSMTPGNIPLIAPTETYRGFELYTGWLNWRAPLQFGFAADRQDIDFGTGRTRTHSASHYAVRTRRHNWTLRNREAARDFRGWLGRRMGVAVPVYMPTDVADFTLVADIDAGDAFLDVTDSLYGELAGAHPALRDVYVKCRDGRAYARRITGVTSLGNDRIRLALDTPIPDAAARDTVKRISYLSLYRQASNATTVQWLTDEVGVVECDLVPKYTVDD